MKIELRLAAVFFSVFGYQSHCSDYHRIVTNWLHLSRSRNPPDQSHCNVKLTLCNIFFHVRALMCTNFPPSICNCFSPRMLISVKFSAGISLRVAVKFICSSWFRLCGKNNRFRRFRHALVTPPGKEKDSIIFNKFLWNEQRVWWHINFPSCDA